MKIGKKNLKQNKNVNLKNKKIAIYLVFFILYLIVQDFL